MKAEDIIALVWLTSLMSSFVAFVLTFWVTWRGGFMRDQERARSLPLNAHIPEDEAAPSSGSHEHEPSESANETERQTGSNPRPTGLSASHAPDEETPCGD